MLVASHVLYTISGDTLGILDDVITLVVPHFLHLSKLLFGRHAAVRMGVLL